MASAPRSACGLIVGAAGPGIRAFCLPVQVSGDCRSVPESRTGTAGRHGYTALSYKKYDPAPPR